MKTKLHSSSTGLDVRNRPLIAVIEAEQDLIALISYNLEREGYSVIVAYDGDDGFQTVTERNPDAVILDWMLPETSGIAICKRIRANTATAVMPILMLTALSEERDLIRGLDAGADDCMVKPFSPAELVARLNAIMRRSKPVQSDEVLRCDDLTMDLTAHRVRRGFRDIHLCPIEYRLLRHFLTNPGRVYSRQQLLDAVWGPNVHIEPRTVDAHIRRLRVAVNGDSSIDLIRTVRSAGYALNDCHNAPK